MTHKHQRANSEKREIIFLNILNSEFVDSYLKKLYNYQPLLT